MVHPFKFSKKPCTAKDETSRMEMEYREKLPQASDDYKKFSGDAFPMDGKMLLFH
jgi:hypothetical protein